MLGVPGLMGGSGDGAAAAEAHESGGASGGSSEVGASSSVPGGGVEESGGGGGGNRWPRQETLALLRIRSDMDVAFRDSSLKGPLWEEVSRKLGELGFQRSAKKCKEKFENVYKYHKRTKDGRASKSDGKTYRFFDQLQALENSPPPSFTPPPPPRPTAPPQSMPVVPITVSSTSPNPLSVVHPTQTPNIPINSPHFQPSQPPTLQAAAPPAMNALNPPQPHFNSTSSSSTSSDEDIQMRRGKKRKWKDFFHKLMTDVIHKQEELQKKFLDTLEKRERDRMAREEAWRVQEMARLNREHDLFVQERSIAASKDAAVISFLQKVTEQKDLKIPISSTALTPPPVPAVPVVVPMQHPPPPHKEQQQQPPPTAAMAPAPQQLSAALPSLPVQPKPAVVAPVVVTTMTTTTTPTKAVEASKQDNGGSSSRWPKAEVQALINLRTSLDTKYQENGPKGPLWEEISAAMAKIGYNRSSKRCKEKWENINKYYKKVKESNKKRPEDSKTCPYFHQLEAIYKERSKPDAGSFSYAVKPDSQMGPIMARPEQQWPLSDQPNQENESENNEEDDDDDDEEDEGGGYEMVTNKPPSTAE